MEISFRGQLLSRSANTWLLYGVAHKKAVHAWFMSIKQMDS